MAKLKLSEAILKGMRKTGMVRGKEYRLNGKPLACALGAAGFGVRIIPKDNSHLEHTRFNRRLYRRFPELNSEQVNLPESLGRKYKTSLGGAIATLNDEAMWDRRKIALWVAKQGY